MRKISASFSYTCQARVTNLPTWVRPSSDPPFLTLRNEASSLFWKLSAALPKLKLFLPEILSLSPLINKARPGPVGELARRNLSIFLLLQNSVFA